MTKQNKLRSESVNPFKKLAIDDKIIRESKLPQLFSAVKFLPQNLDEGLAIFQVKKVKASRNLLENDEINCDSKLKSHQYSLQWCNDAFENMFELLGKAPQDYLNYKVFQDFGNQGSLQNVPDKTITNKPKSILEIVTQYYKGDTPYGE